MDFRQTVIVLSLMGLLSGCERALNLEGELKIENPAYDSISVVSYGGHRFKLQGGNYRFELIGATTLFVYLPQQERPLRLLFRGDLTPLEKQDRLLVSAGESGQKFDLRFTKKRRRVDRRQQKKYISCWYPAEEWFYQYKIPIKKEVVLQGSEYALVRLDRYEVVYQIDFISSAEHQAVAQFISAPLAELEEVVLKRDPAGCR